MKRLTQIFCFILLAVFIGCAVLHFLAAGNVQALMLNADALNIPTVIDNLLSHQGSLSHWYLSPAPYLFPDALVHAAIHPMTESMYARLAIFVAVQIAALFLVIWKLASRTCRNHPLAIAVAITGQLTWMALLRGSPYDQIMTAGFHYGAFVVSIAVVTLSFSRTHQYRNWCVIAILCSLTSLSDNIFVIQTTIPLVLTLAFIALFDSEHRAHRLITAAVAMFSSVIGSISYGLVISKDTRYPIHFDVHKFRVNAVGVRDIGLEFLRTHRPIAAALIVSCLLAMFYSVRLAKRIRRTTPIAMLSIFSFASVVSTCAGLVLATTNEMTLRYFIPVFSWPIIIVGLVVLNSEMFWGKLPVLVAGISALLLSLNTSTLVDTQGINYSYYPEDIACIDRALPSTKAAHGMANYWDAKYIQAFSKKNITLAQHLDILMPMKWITTEDYFHSTYDFAIISTNSIQAYTLSQELLVKKYGQPRSATTCGTRIVLVFQPGE